MNLNRVIRREECQTQRHNQNSTAIIKLGQQSSSSTAMASKIWIFLLQIVSHDLNNLFSIRTESKNSSQHNQNKKAHRNGYSPHLASPFYHLLSFPTTDTCKASWLGFNFFSLLASRSLKPIAIRLSKAPTLNLEETIGMLFMAPWRLWWAIKYPLWRWAWKLISPPEGSEGREASSSIICVCYNSLMSGDDVVKPWFLDFDD